MEESEDEDQTSTSMMMMMDNDGDEGMGGNGSSTNHHQPYASGSSLASEGRKRKNQTVESTCNLVSER